MDVWKSEITFSVPNTYNIIFNGFEPARSMMIFMYSYSIFWHLFVRAYFQFVFKRFLDNYSNGMFGSRRPRLNCVFRNYRRRLHVAFVIRDANLCRFLISTEQNGKKMKNLIKIFSPHTLTARRAIRRIASVSFPSSKQFFDMPTVLLYIILCIIVLECKNILFYLWHR